MADENKIKVKVRDIANVYVPNNIAHWKRQAFSWYTHYFGQTDYEFTCAKELYNHGIVNFWDGFPLINAAPGGINKYELPEFIVAVNPKMQKYSGTFIRSDKRFRYLRDEKEIGALARYYCKDLANFDSTINNYLIEHRDGGDRTASDDITAESIKTMLRARALGDQTVAVYDKDIAEYELIHRQNSTDRLTEYTESRRILLNNLKETLGIPIDIDKRSQQNDQEIAMLNALSVINKEHIERLARIVHKQYERYKDKLDGKEVTE